MHKARELYEKRVSLTLASFQITELLLKEYIALSYEVMKHLLRDHIAFSPSGRDVENYSMERLITTFKTVNDNNVLIKQLQGVVEHRNRIAHRSLLPLYRGKASDAEYWRLIDEISPLETEIDKCMDGIQAELDVLRSKAEPLLRD